MTPNPTLAEPNDEEEEDDDVMIIPTPSAPREKQPVLSVDDDVDPIPTPVIPEKQPVDDVDVDVPCEDQPVIPEEHTVEDDMDVDDVYEEPAGPHSNPITNCEAQGWRPLNIEFRPKLHVLRK